MGIAPFETAEPGHVQQLHDPPATALAPGQAETDVLFHRQVREQAPVLRHKADASPFGSHIALAVVDALAPEPHSAVIGTLEAGDHPEQCRLPAA